MYLKFPAFLLALIFAATACAPAPTPVATVISPTQDNINTVVPAQPTVSVPKHKDLIFVEFFAVT
jgi:hypothetical protein